jgi:hypothetical protein
MVYSDQQRLVLQLCHHDAIEALALVGKLLVSPPSN